MNTGAATKKAKSRMSYVKKQKKKDKKKKTEEKVSLVDLM